MAIFYTDSGSFETLEVTGSTILSGSLIVSGATNFGPSGLTGSLFGTASYADSSSYALTASYAANGASTPAFPFSGSAVITGSLFISQSISGTPALRATGSIDFVTGSSRISTTADGVNLAGGTTNISISSNNTSISFTAGGGNIASINGVGIVPSNIGAWIGDPGDGDNSRWQIYSKAIDNSGTIGSSIITATQFTASNARINGSVSASSYTSSLNNQVGFLGTSSFAVSSSRAISASFAQTAISASYFSGSVSFPDGLTVGQLTASNAQLTNIVDTTATNKILVLNTTNNQIFTTASVGGGGGPAGTAFPFSGSAVITGSLYVTSSVANPVTITGSVNDYFELEIINAHGGNAASTDIVASNNATTDFGNYIDMGINSTTFAGALVGGPSDGYLYFTSSVGELHVGHASTGNSSNIRLFAGGPSSDLTTRVFISGSGNVGIGTTTPNEKLVIVGNQTLTGSVYIEGNGATNTNLYGTNTIDDFNQIIAQNLSATTNASTDFVAAADNATDFQNFADFGINSSAFVGLIGNANDGYLYITSSLGELVIGNASTGTKGNVRLFTGAGDTDNVTRIFISSSGNVGVGTVTPKTRFEVAGNQIISGSLIVTQTGSNGGIQIIGNALTGSVFSGSFVNILEMSMAVSGTIAANGTSTVTLDINQANYFTVSASVAGTTTWVVNNPPPAGRVQTFVLEYTNGGIKTNSWFTNTRWPAGVAPTLTSASANPDILSFTTDDNGSNWRGLLLQRGSA